MWHHTGLSNSFWIYAVKAKLHTHNVTLIKWADYKTPTELWFGIKLNISHLQVLGCQAWVHILKKRRHKLEPKSWEMIFIGYEPGSKGYQFWDAAHQHFEMSHDLKFEGTLFPVKEGKSTKLDWTLLNDPPISESDTLGLDIVISAQPPTSPPNPGLSALRQTAQKHQKQTHPNPPIAPSWVPTFQIRPRACYAWTSHNSLFVLQGNDWLTKINPLGTISIVYWLICSKRLQIHTKKHWIWKTVTNGLLILERNLMV